MNCNEALQSGAGPAVVACPGSEYPLHEGPPACSACSGPPAVTLLYSRAAYFNGRSQPRQHAAVTRKGSSESAVPTFFFQHVKSYSPARFCFS